MAKSTPKYSFETIDEVLSDIKQSKGLATSVSKPSLSSSKSVLPENNINSVLSYGGGNPNKALRVAEYNVPMSSVFERLNDGTYTSKFENYLGAEGNENRLAQQQSGWEQAGKGLLKNVLKVGSYATDSVIGTAYGLTKALTSGSLRDLYDNELTNKLDDMNKKLDYALPNYYSDEQKSMSFLRQLGTVNFWANDVAGGFAFVGGALLPQIAIGIATGGASLPSLGVTLGKMGAKLGLKAAKEVGEEAAKAALKKGLKSTLDDGLKAIGSTAQKIGNATGYTKGKNVIKSYQTGILGEKLGTFTNTTGFLARSAGFEAGMEARQAMKESVDNYYQKFSQQNGRMPTFEESQTFMNDAVKASNKVFGANMAILTLSNAVMYGKKILPESTSNWINKTIGGKVNNIIGLGTKSAVVDGKLTYTMLGANRAQKLAGKAYKTLSKPLVEGIYEEGLQGVASKTMKNYIDAKYDKNNLDGYSFWGSLNDSFAEQYGTNEGWKEMTIGMIVGFAGGGMTPGAIKNGYAFSGFGKNSYSSRRSEIESNIKRANDGIELLSNLNRTSATVAKEAAMNSGNQSDFIGAEDTLSHYNFIRSQESINSYSQMRNDYNTVIDNLQLEDESLSALESAGLDVDSYKSKLKSDFEKSVNNYQFAKKAVESLGLNNKLKDTPGNIAEVSDALMFGLMAGKDSFENARNIGSQIDSIIGTEGVANYLEFYNNLEQDQKDQFLELRDKQENLKQLQDAAAKVAQKIGKINSTGQMTPEFVENRRKRLSEQAVAIQDSITNTQQRIDEIKDTLSTNFRESKYNLTSEELGKFETVEDVIGAVENIDKIDNLVQSFTKAGKAQEADTLRYLVQQFKISSDSHREMINNYRKMMDTNFFSSKEGKGFLKSILGNKFTMSDDFKKLIQENNAVIDNSLGLNGIRGYETVQKQLEEVIANNNQLSDREKFRLESLIRLSLSKDAYEKAVDDLQSASKNMQVRMSPEGRQLATKPEDLRRISLTKEGLNNIDLLDKAINEITKELDYIINYSTKNIDKIKQLEEELENLRQQREDIIENNKNKQTAPETTATATATEDIEAKKADIERRRQEELNNRRITNTNNDGKWDVAADYLLTGGTGTVLSTDYLLLGIAGVFDKATGLIDDIRNRYAQELAESTQVDVKDFIGTELYNRVINDIKSAINEVYSNTKEANDILEQILKNPTGASNRIGNEISGKISKLTEDQNRIINSKYDAELASLEGKLTSDVYAQPTSTEGSVQQNAPFSAPEQTVSAEQEEIQNNITSLEEELNNLNQQRDEINSLIDKQNQVSEFTPEQVEKFKKKWDYYTSVNLTEEEDGEYIKWIQSEEGSNWIQKQYPTESMHQDLRNLYQVMPFRKFAYAVRKYMDPFFSEKSAIKDLGRKMSFEEWAGYIIGDGALEFSKNGYYKLIDSLDDSVLENAGIQRPSVKSETEQATEVKEEEQPKTAEEFVTLLDKQANEDKDKIGFPIKTSEGVFVSSIDGKYRVSYPHKGRSTGYAEKKRLTREEAIKLISEKSKLPTSTNKTKQTTEIKEEVSSDSPLKIAEQKINNLKEGESVKAYEITITKNSDGTFTIEKKDQEKRSVDKTSATSILATGIAEDSKGKNINLKDYDIEEVKGEELGVGDIYVRDIGGVRFVYRLLSIPKRDVLKGNFFRSDVEILHIGKHKVSILRNPDGTLYESSADIKVGNKSVDTFKSLNKNYRTFGKVKKINNWTDVSAPITTNTINQQLEDYTSRKEEIEKNIVDLENQINDLKSTLDSVKNKVGESFKVDYNNGKLTKGDFGGSRNLGVFDYKGKIVKVVKSKRKISPEQIQSMKDRLGDMDNVYFAEESIDLGDKKAAIVMSKAKGVDASSLTKEDIDNIPQEHWNKLEQDVRELSKRGVQIDLTKRDNLFYDRNNGFEFIDINGISMDESSTDKFFEKDGVEYYYPFEQYRFFPKKFEGGKAMFENIPESNTQSVQSAAQPTSTEEPTQQNFPLSVAEQTIPTEQEEIEKKIADLEKQLDDLKRPFKIIESPEYIRYSELASRAEKENLTEVEKQELEELRADIDQWTMITGVVVDGFRLSDLLLQKSVLENTVIEKSKDIEIPTSEDTLDDETFADVTTRANYSFGLVYDKVFASKSGDIITLHNINAKSLEDILGKEFMDANGIVLEEDKTGKENVVLSQASIDIINEKSNIRIRKSERNMLTNYSVVLERIVGLDGNVTYKPLNSTFSEEFNDGKGHDIQAVFEANTNDSVEITTDLDNVYNIRVINEYKEELNNYNSKAQKSEQDRIELEKAYNKLVSKLNMQAKINGRVVSTMKGLNKTVQDRESDNVYVSLRNNIFSNPEQFNTILTGSGEYSVRITNNAGEFIKPNITVSQVLMGHPNYNYTETEDGVLATEFKPLSDVEAKAIVDIGYVVGTKTFTRDNQTVNTMFLKKMMNKKSTNKIPFVVLNVGGKRVAYPAKVNSFGEAEVSEFENVYNNKSADPVTKANALNRILAKNGIDIKTPGNSFIGFFDNNINDSFFQEKLAQLKNVNYFYNVEDWLDLNIDLNDIVKSQISLDINVLNPFHSPKLSFSYDNLDLKDFVPPKKGSKKKKSSKSKNVEVNIAELFNKENCI